MEWQGGSRGSVERLSCWVGFAGEAARGGVEVCGEGAGDRGVEALAIAASVGLSGFVGVKRVDRSVVGVTGGVEREVFSVVSVFGAGDEGFWGGMYV